MITTALQFSGGKDSLALLHLWRNKLDRTLVCWVNTGASYPETLKQMRQLKETVPHFLEITSDQPSQVEKDGYPVDLVPLPFTPLGREMVGEPYNKLVRLQDSFRCCSAKIWAPMAQAMKANKITTVLRGQKNSDKYKTTYRSGYVEDGITYIFPLETWTDEQVFEYLKTNNVSLPDHYARGEKKSHDCWSCTGYLDEDAGRIANLPPNKRQEVLLRLDIINAAIQHQAEPLKQILGDNNG